MSLPEYYISSDSYKLLFLLCFPFQSPKELKEFVKQTPVQRAEATLMHLLDTTGRAYDICVCRWPRFIQPLQEQLYVQFL